MKTKGRVKDTQYKTAHNLTLVLLIAVIWLMGTQYSKAQLNPFQSAYFQNRYLSDPAMAGYEQGLNINAGYRHQWSSIPGTPKTQTLTADYQASDRVGLGLNINGDQSGLITQTRIVGTYAYRILLNGTDQKLSFGLSFGINDPHIDYNNVNGDQTDVQIADYNQTKAYVDGDFGVAYTSKHLIIEGVVPNLKAAFFNNEDSRIDVDRTTFMAAASYLIFVNNGDSNLTLEPKVEFRGVKGFDNLFDAGLNLTLNDLGLNFSGVYHSNQAAGFGFGILGKTMDINLAYNLETGQIRSYTDGTFELGLKIKLFKK